jgi:hypothetical protein
LSSQHQMINGGRPCLRVGPDRTPPGRSRSTAGVLEGLAAGRLMMVHKVRCGRDADGLLTRGQDLAAPTPALKSRRSSSATRCFVGRPSWARCQRTVADIDGEIAMRAEEEMPLGVIEAIIRLLSPPRSRRSFSAAPQRNLGASWAFRRTS